MMTLIGTVQPPTLETCAHGTLVITPQAACCPTVRMGRTVPPGLLRSTHCAWGALGHLSCPVPPVRTGGGRPVRVSTVGDGPLAEHLVGRGGADLAETLGGAVGLLNLADHLDTHQVVTFLDRWDGRRQFVGDTQWEHRHEHLVGGVGLGLG